MGRQPPVAASERTGTRARRALVALGLLAGALLLGAGALRAAGVGPWAVGAPGDRSAAPATATVDPRLILVPHTVTQTAAAGAVSIALTTGPLIPGPNRFAVALAVGGRPLAGVRVLLVATMVGMAMSPVTLPLSEVQPGYYTATGPLTMFGAWQLTLQIDRPGAAALTHQFAVGVNLPPGLLAAPATRVASQP